MKKIGIALIVLVVLAGISTGIYFGVKASKEEKQADEIYYNLDYIEDQYVAGDMIVLRVSAQDDKAFTAMKYSIDSGEEKTLTVTTGKTEGNSKLDVKNGEYFIDTGIEVIDSTGLKTGTHVLQVYTMQDTTKILIFEKVFKIADAA